MEEKKVYEKSIIKAIDSKKKEEILAKSVRDLPDNPASMGYSASDIKKHFYEPEADILNALDTLETRVVNEFLEVEYAIDEVNKSFKTDLENGQGKNSLQLPPDGEDFTYTSSGVSYTYKNGTNGKEALNFSSKGKIYRNHYANIGNQNVAESDEKNPNSEDDGGIFVGYKNYTNSRNVGIVGAHNRVLNTNNALLGGYQNAIQGTFDENGNINHGRFLLFGEKCYLFGLFRNSLFVGLGIKNASWKNHQYHLGLFNDPGDREDRIMFSIGNGTGTISYEIAPNIDITRAKELNKQFILNPNKDDWYYTGTEDGVKTLVTDDTPEDILSDTVKLWCQKLNRTNAIQVTEDGRVQIFQKKTNIWKKDEKGDIIFENNAPVVEKVDFVPKGDNDLLTQKEIKNLISTTETNITVDSELSTESENPVQNKIVTEALNKKFNIPTSEQLVGGTGPYAVTFNINGEPTYRLCNAVYIYSHGANPLPAYKEVGKAFANPVEQLPNIKNTIFLATPLLDYEGANKKYVDENKGTKLYKHTVSYDYTENNGTYTNTITFYSTSGNVESYSIVELGGWVYIENIDNIVSVPRYISDRYIGLMELVLAIQTGYAFVIKYNSGLTISNIQKAVE